MNSKHVDFSALKGLVIKEIIGDTNSEVLKFVISEHHWFTMRHYQDCCESVYIDEIHGDLDDLAGSEILFAEETCYHERDEEYGDSATWTFYKAATIKGHVTIKWCGSSNGYYSESVDVEEWTDPEVEKIIKNPPTNFGIL